MAGADAVGSAMSSTGANAIGNSMDSATAANNVLSTADSSGAIALFDTLVRSNGGSSTTSPNIAVSGSSGSFSTTDDSAVDVTNLIVSITTTGRPVRLEIIPDTSVSSPTLQILNAKTDGTVHTTTGNYAFYRDGVLVRKLNLFLAAVTDSTTFANPSLRVFPSSLSHIDFVSPGTYVYKLAINGLVSGNTQVEVNFCRLIAYEI